jgi:hypothetical protein
MVFELLSLLLEMLVPAVTLLVVICEQSRPQVVVVGWWPLQAWRSRIFDIYWRSASGNVC